MFLTRSRRRDSSLSFQYLPFNCGTARFLATAGDLLEVGAATGFILMFMFVSAATYYAYQRLLRKIYVDFWSSKFERVFPARTSDLWNFTWIFRNPVQIFFLKNTVLEVFHLVSRDQSFTLLGYWECTHIASSWAASIRLILFKNIF